MTAGRGPRTRPDHPKIVPDLQHQHLENRSDVMRLTIGIALALLLVDDLQQRP